MLFSVFPIGMMTLGFFMLRNPMLFWQMERSKPSWCRRYNEPDESWQTETRIMGGFFIVVGILGLLFEINQLFKWLF
jgi:hypothetical protein